MHYRTEKGYPLSIEVTTIRCEQQSSPDKEFLLNLLPKVNYPALLKAVQDLSPHCGNNEIPALPELPETLDVSNKETLDLDDTVIANLYRKVRVSFILSYEFKCSKRSRVDLVTSFELNLL